MVRRLLTDCNSLVLGLMLTTRLIHPAKCFLSCSRIRSSSGGCISGSHVWLSSSSVIFSSDSETQEQSPRTNALHEQLQTLGIDSTDLHRAALRSIETPTEGYDVKYGKSAIKAYRAFVYPRKEAERKKDDSISDMKMKTKALTAARQVEFLMKRHASREAEWVRHTDDAAASRRSFPLILLLDNVRSAFNVGSLFRTADACGCAEVITTGISPHPFGSGAEKLSKSALGADRHVPSRHFTTTREAIEVLRNEKGPSWKLIGMETTERSVLYTQLKYPGNANTDSGDTSVMDEGTVLVLGNEVTGVDTEIMPILDEVVEIPMFGAKNSLNIAACAPVVLYEILRQWGVMEDSSPNE